MSRVITLLPNIGFPHQHPGALTAIDRFCAALRPRAVIQTGRLFASMNPSRPDMEAAAHWLGNLGNRTRLILVADHDHFPLASQVIRMTRGVDAIAVETEYRLEPGWSVHAGDTSTTSTGGAFPGATAIALAHQNRTNVICGHTGQRGIVNEVRETDTGLVELWGVEAGHLDTTRPDGLGFGVLSIDTDHRVKPTLVRVSRRGGFSYGGAPFGP